MALPFHARPLGTHRAPSRPCSPLPWAFGLVLALATTLLAVGLLDGAGPDAVPSPLSLSETIARASAPYAFDLVRWEIAAGAEGALRRARASLSLSALDEAQQRDLVVRHTALSAEVRRLRRQLDAIPARSAVGETEQGSTELDRQLAAAEADLASLSEAATEIIARQIDGYLASEGLAGPPLKPIWRPAVPPLSFEVNPPVFFRFERLPLLLVVAPRDKIKVLHGGFLEPGLSQAEVEAIELKIDRHDVASVVLPIGGFAAYPSMVPPGGSLPSTLRVVAHEWLHHYLALRPLGQGYFSSYALRSVNETVADLAGKEIGDAVFQRYYAAGLASRASEPTQRGAAPADRSTFNFAQAMAEVRRGVEAFLSVGDVRGAEQHMAERKRWLEDNGYYLRKLNTAYLTFYGAYAGTGNPYEPGLRRLRAESDSLADFLRRVAAVGSERDLDILIGN